jgi:hypothetical protein
MSLLIALAAFSQPLDPVDCGFLSFSRAPAPPHSSEQVCITHDPDARGDYLLRRTAIGRGSAVVTWAMTRRCPAVRAQLAAMENLQLPALDVPGLGQETKFITLDGVIYRLEGTARFGGAPASVMLQSNVNTPLARWIAETFAVLEPCWRERPNTP